MDSQYINCPECGVRNFAEDKVCGVCKTKLKSAIIQKTTTPPAIQSVNFKTFFLIIGGFLFIYYVFIKDSITNKKSSEEAYSETYLKNSPETQMAIINDYTRSPKQITVELFNGLLISLNNKYSNRTKQEIANALVASHNIIIKNGQDDLLLKFTTAFDAYSKEVDNKFNFSIEEALVLFIKMTYRI
jgi:hypothetical protein